MQYPLKFDNNAFHLLSKEIIDSVRRSFELSDNLQQRINIFLARYDEKSVVETFNRFISTEVSVFEKVSDIPLKLIIKISSIFLRQQYNDNVKDEDLKHACITAKNFRSYGEEWAKEQKLGNIENSNNQGCLDHTDSDKNISSILKTVHNRTITKPPVPPNDRTYNY